MVTRGPLLAGFLLVLAAGAFALAQQYTVPQAPDQPAAAEPSVAAQPDPTPPAEPAPSSPAAAPLPAAPPPVVAAPAPQPIEVPPAAAESAANTASQPAPLAEPAPSPVAEPMPAAPPPVVAEPSPQPIELPPVVTAPPIVPPTPAPVVAAPPAAEPAQVASAPPADEPAETIVDPPLPLTRPVITKMTIPAKALFVRKELPSLGKAMAIGYYPRGCLQGGVELPVDGPNWQVMRVSRNRNWGHPALIEYLERFAPLAAKATGWNGILVGDLSQPRGGPTPYGHRSHQTGLDVDIWFVPMPDRRLTRKERDTIPFKSLVADDWKSVNPNVWTPAHAVFIQTAAEQPEVERVLVNAAIKKKLCEMQGKNKYSWMKKVRPWYAHHDHIHVRLACPPDSPHCRAQPPVPNDDGCGKGDLAHWFSDKVLNPRPAKGGGKPPRQMTLADLPPACTDVLDSPAKKIDTADGR